ncbi:MAG: hypothetical protein AAGI53_17305 [Planctomycetota bacterium]
MPPTRDYGWKLRPTSSSHFEICERPNGQFCVVLNHALLRGVTSEMIHWWFRHFPSLRVRLVDTPGFEGQVVPAYLLWHPIDHYNATLSGRLGPNRTARAGASIHVQEAMQYDRFGWKYPVDSKLKIFYVGADGWAMGRTLPMLGPVMILRIHFKDVVRDGQHVGVHYHYEIVIGLTGNNPIAKGVNHRVTAEFGTEFFDAWHRHNVIEVGVFENFLAPLFAQRESLHRLEYRIDMDAMPESDEELIGFDHDLFAQRVRGYRDEADPFAYQAFRQPTFLSTDSKR